MKKTVTITVCSDCPHCKTHKMLPLKATPMVGGSAMLGSETDLAYDSTFIPECLSTHKKCERKWIRDINKYYPKKAEDVWVSFDCQLKDPLPGQKTHRFKSMKPARVRRYSYSDFVDLMEVCDYGDSQFQEKYGSGVFSAHGVQIPKFYSSPV